MLNIGDAALIDAIIQRDGQVVNPATLVYTVHPPTGSDVTYTAGSSSEVTNLSIGVYRLRLPLTQSGIYKIRNTATNPAAVEETSLLVSPPAF